MATITEDYVDFEIAKLLKEKGFDGACNRVYQGPNLKYTTIPISPLMSLGEFGGFHPKQLYVTNKELGDIAYTAPTLQMAMKWLREVHNTFISIIYENDGVFVANLKLPLKGVDCMIDDKHNCWFTYEEACEASIKYCLKNLI